MKVAPIAADEYAAFARGVPTTCAQQTGEWGRVVEGIGLDTPVFFGARDGALVGALMAFRFEGPCGPVLISVPQPGGYGGVVGEGHEVLVPAFVEHARATGCLLATISTPPFFTALERYRALPPDWERENFVQYLPLDADTLALRGAPGKLGQDFRRKVRKSEAVRIAMDDTDAHFEAWYSIHHARMSEIGAAPLPRALFEGARTEMIARGLGFFVYGFDGDRLVAGALFIGHGRVMDVFMLSGGADAMASHANTAVVVAAMHRAQAEGYEILNWQSSSSKTSSVYRYKQSFGSKDGAHHYLSWRTGDLEPLRRVPREVLRSGYRWHYLLPYEAL